MVRPVLRLLGVAMRVARCAAAVGAGGCTALDAIGMVAMSPRLWLVRQGATDWSDAGRLTGWSDITLNGPGGGIWDGPIDEWGRRTQLLRRRLRSTEFDGTMEL
jgi:hypothetical protein